MLTLRKDSPFVRLAFMTSDRYRKTGPPDSITLCSIFWRAVLPVLLLCGVIAFCVGAGLDIYQNIDRNRPLISISAPEDAGGWIAFSLCVTAFIVFVLALYIAKNPESWLGTIFWAIKHRVCPVVQLHGEDRLVEWSPELRDVARVMRNLGLPAVQQIDDAGPKAVASDINSGSIAYESFRLHEALKKTFGEHQQWSVLASYHPETDTALIAVTKR